MSLNDTYGYINKAFQIQVNSRNVLEHQELNLKSDSQVPENFSQIKIFTSHVRKNTIIRLFGV